jgi:c-di-GMP-related signal transduction protein
LLNKYLFEGSYPLGGFFVNIYLARQPIFNRQQKVVAYELLYRSNEENYNTEPDSNLATSEVIASSFLNIGLDKLTRRKKAFINFTKQLLEDDTAYLLPKDLVAIEITEDIIPDQKTFEACEKLFGKGYSLVLDDFDLKSKFKSLFHAIEIVKVDYQQTDRKERAEIVELFRLGEMKLLAEKVETVSDYGDAMSNGYDYFQGYFFCEPSIVIGREIPSTKLHNLQLLQEIYKAEIDFDRVETLIKQDPSLSYKLLRFINSIAFPVRFPIRSIRQAMALLGQQEIIKWASLVALRNVGYDKPDELIITAVSRARFCESVALATIMKNRSADLFLTGLLSLLDTFLDQPMENILKELPLAEEIKDALLGRDGDFKNIFDLVLLYEKGSWEKAFEIAATKYNLDEVEVMSYYLESLELADMAWK